MAFEDYDEYEQSEQVRKWLRENGRDRKALGAFDVNCARTFIQHSYIGRELLPSTNNNYMTFFVSLWNWFKDSGFTATNPFKEVKRMRTDPDRSGTRRPPTLEERALIRPYLAKRPRFNAFCMLCFHCAIRPNEAFQLKPENFHLEQQSITVPGRIAKNRRTQGVAVPDVMMPLLRALQLHKQHPDHFVFSTGFRPGAKQKDSRDSGKAWSKLREATGLPKAVTLYQLKHAGGEQLSRDGIGEVDLMNHFRHHDLAETSIYTKRNYAEGVRTVVHKASEF